MAQLVKWKDIDYSPKAEKALMELPKGKVMLVRMNRVSNGKIQLEFAEKIDNPNPVRSALGLLNKSDKRFNFSTGARRSWETAEPADVKALFGVEIPEDESHVEVLQVLPTHNGLEFRIQITEITEDKLSASQKEYADNYLKRAGKDGSYFYTPSGLRVASIASLVTAPIGTEINHTYLEGSYRDVSASLKEVMGIRPEITVVT